MGLFNALSKVSLILIVLILIMPGLMVNPAQAAKPTHTPDPTKIVPTDGAQPPHPFTVIDTPAGRLVDGTVAVFKKDGGETVLDLRTHKPFKTAKGELPEGMAGGDYTVFFRQPDGTEIELGPFTVHSEVIEYRPPFMEPTEGPPGTLFTITDDKGGMASADRIIFAMHGTGPEAGIPVEDPQFFADGKTATGRVPSTVAPGLDYDVTVHNGDPTVNPPLFNALFFFVS
ncbi:MAG: hypothetical protein JSV49_08675 [Thermoplasmata archaeon]|nr:MAG: hypothetical protein JSV49_08675 [Thermoplasmata archaeon]